MKNLNFSVAAVSMMLIASPLLAQDVKPKPVGDAAPMMAIDRATFVGMVSSAKAFEIRSSELARQKAENDDLKKAADMIISNHTKAGKKLRALLQAKDAAPADPVNLAPKHRKMIDQLQAAKGKDFDSLYLDMQAQAHMEAIGLFRTYAGSGDDQTLVGFARETLPALDTHLGHVKMLIAEQ